MAQIKGTNVASPVVPFDTADANPSHEALYGKGGYRTVATTAARDAIPPARREAGMLVHVTADGVVYELAGDLTTWAPFTPPPGVHNHVAADITDFTAAVVAAAPPTTDASLLTAGTLPDARLSANIARTSDVTTAVNAVIDAAPAALDTLNELAAALGDDANFAGSVTTALAGKAAAVHTHAIADVTGLQTALDGKQASGSYAAAVHTHGISDVTGLQTALDGKQASGSYAASSHAHGNITNAGAIGSTANLPIITTTSGVLTAGSFGTTANTFCQGNDSRLSDTRTPTDGSVTTAKIANGAVTAAKIDSSANIVCATVTVSGLNFSSLGYIASQTVGLRVRPTVGTSDYFVVNTSGQVTVGTWQATAVAVAYGGTGATTAAGARTNLGLGTLATQDGTFSGTSSGTNTGDEVAEYAATTNFPGTGSTTVLYLATDTSRAYRWTGSEYVEVGPVATYPITHVHAASDITSGTISPQRLPITSGTAAPSGGADGDIYLQYTA